MKTLGRVLMIMAVFVLVMGVTYAVVNTNRSSGTAPAFGRGEGFSQEEGIQSRFPDGERPDFDRDGRGVGAWMFGMIKNVVILAVIVTLIVVPKNLMRKKPVPVSET
jgi:hypothetical protein